MMINFKTYLMKERDDGFHISKEKMEMILNSNNKKPNNLQLKMISKYEDFFNILLDSSNMHKISKNYPMGKEAANLAIEISSHTKNNAIVLNSLNGYFRILEKFKKDFLNLPKDLQNKINNSPYLYKNKKFIPKVGAKKVKANSLGAYKTRAAEYDSLAAVKKQINTEEDSGDLLWLNLYQDGMFDDWRHTFNETGKLLNDIFIKDIDLYDIVIDSQASPSPIQKALTLYSKKIGFDKSDHFSTMDGFYVLKRVKIQIANRMIKILESEDGNKLVQAMNGFIFDMHKKGFMYFVSLKKIEKGRMGRRQLLNIPSFPLMKWGDFSTSSMELNINLKTQNRAVLKIFNKNDKVLKVGGQEITFNTRKNGTRIWIYEIFSNGKKSASGQGSISISDQQKIFDFSMLSSFDTIPQQRIKDLEKNIKKLQSITKYSGANYEEIAKYISDNKNSQGVFVYLIIHIILSIHENTDHMNAMLNSCNKIGPKHPMFYKIY